MNASASRSSPRSDLQLELLAPAHMEVMLAIHPSSFAVACVALPTGAHAQVGSEARATVQIRVSVAPRFALDAATLTTADQKRGEVAAMPAAFGARGLRYSLVETPIRDRPGQHCGAGGTAPSRPAGKRIFWLCRTDSGGAETGRS